jgi:hypothetical protein
MTVADEEQKLVNGKTFLAYKNAPSECCCTRYPKKFHYHVTPGEVLLRNNLLCKLCDEFPNGYHVHYKKDCGGCPLK